MVFQLDVLHRLMHHHQRLPSRAHGAVCLPSGNAADLRRSAPPVGALAVVAIRLDEQHWRMPSAGFCRCAVLLPLLQYVELCSGQQQKQLAVGDVQWQLSNAYRARVAAAVTLVQC